MHQTLSQYLNNRTKIMSFNQALWDYLKQVSVKIAKEAKAREKLNKQPWDTLSWYRSSDWSKNIADSFNRYFTSENLIPESWKEKEFRAGIKCIKVNSCWN